MNRLVQDVRYGVRVLLANPGFSAAAVLILALAIGANTAIFSVVNAVLLRPLPFHDPARLTMVWEKNPALGMPMPGAHVMVSPVNYLAWRKASLPFEDLAATRDTAFHLTRDGQPERISAARGSASLFPLLGVTPLLGRTFEMPDERSGAGRVVVLSYGFWKQRFGGDRGIIGKSIDLNKEAYTVIGVLPAQFHFPAIYGGLEQKKPELWAPLAMDQTSDRSLLVFGRLKTGIAVEQAQAAMDVIGRHLEESNPKLNKGWGVSVFPVESEDRSPTVARTLLLLSGAVGFVLLIGCANVANLLLARATGRRREMAIRSALGASSLRLVRQLLTESILLALAGGAAGILLAAWGIEFLKWLKPGGVNRIETIGLDPLALGFTLAASVTAGVVFGLAPAIGAARQTRIGINSRTGNRLRQALVISEVALSVILLVGAGLAIQSLWRVLSVDIGVRPENLLTARVALRGAKYGPTGQSAAFYRRLIGEVGKLPGVESASAVSGLPLEEIGSGLIKIEGREPVSGAEELGADFRTVGTQYFKTLGTPLLRGRDFTEAELTAGGVAIVNEAFSRQFFPNGDVLDRRIAGGAGGWQRIVGVCVDLRPLGPESGPRPEVIWPGLDSREMTLLIRSGSDPAGLTAAVRGEVAKLDADAPVFRVQKMREVLDWWTSQRRFTTLLLGLFSGVALPIAMAGIYGVVAYAAGRRAREIGIRIALGAQPANVIRLVLHQSARSVVVGIVLGVAGSLALKPALASIVFGVSATDPITLAIAAAAIAGVAAMAAYLPARRAAKLDPASALRYQ